GCFYSGDVNADPDSFAALSLCGGLSGGFSLDGAEYSISPGGPPGGRGDPVERTHVISRRRVANSTGWVVRGPPRRARRFSSVPRFLEALVVADASMAAAHGDDLEHYLLTLMAVVARLYRHPSLRNPVSVVVVGVVVTGEAPRGPRVSGNAALTLRDFCSWQRKLNRQSDRHPDHWDTAMLFTQQDLCGATTCDTLGMADVGTVCDPQRSCSVVEDDGLPTAFTAAHELGHVFNMPHDNVKACRDVFGTLQDHMMSPTLVQVDGGRPWSACSAAILTDFLDRGHGDCLLDRPQKHLSLPAGPPGSAYNLQRQCRLAFGPASRPCPFTPPCSKLWCTGSARGQAVCQTRHFPWADGTGCGGGRVCYRGTCIAKNSTSRPKVQVNGRWGPWGPYGGCSRSCGGGVQLARRECDNPAPENGGKYCHGLRLKYRSCSLRPCPDTGKSFRKQQCEEFNGLKLNTTRLGSSVTWVPKYSGVAPEDQCKLICRANGTGYFYVLAPKVVDGTPCSPDTPSLCIQGRCIKAGCDGRLNSRKKFDKCGVCGGNNQGCKKVSGRFAKPIRGYNFVVTLPVGAANVDIRQRGYRGMSSDENYLAVKDCRGHYLLNGGYVVSAAERDLLVRGGLMRYSGTSPAVETLRAVAPLQEPLTVELLSVGGMTPPRVRYTFYV
uniref:ADAM metallopeptidase with thrombospondin type 1 motif 15 n=1 Tax=Tetraodon nigroviridis TaxID=99883 RepID=H3DA49_TETNG